MICHDFSFLKLPESHEIGRRFISKMYYGHSTAIRDRRIMKLSQGEFNAFSTKASSGEVSVRLRTGCSVHTVAVDMANSLSGHGLDTLHPTHTVADVARPTTPGFFKDNLGTPRRLTAGSTCGERK